jgi:hypothetical protein
MFRLLKLAGTLRTWQIRYCAADFTACARYQVAQTGRSVPQSLMPNGQHLRFATNGRD